MPLIIIMIMQPMSGNYTIKNVFIIPYLPFPPQIALRTASAFRPICVIVATSKLVPCFKIESEFIFS